MPRAKKTPPNRGDQRWEVKITIGRDVKGKLLRKSFYSSISMEDARRKAEEWKINSKASELSGVDFSGESGVEFDKWARAWLQKYKRGKVKENTYSETYERTVENILIPYFKSAPLKLIKPADISCFYTEMQQRYYESTLKKIKLCLNAIFNTAIDNELCYKNPCRNVDYTVQLFGETKRTYNEDEAELVWSFAETHPDGLAIQLLLELGLRCSELLGLRWSDFDLERGTVSIQRAVHTINSRPVVGDTKTEKSKRVLPISGRLKASVARKLPTEDNFIVTNKNGGVYTVVNFAASKYRSFFAALTERHPELPILTPHELRHTCGTLLYARTHDIFAVSRFLGHADINITTKIYVHDDVELLRHSLGVC